MIPEILTGRGADLETLQAMGDIEKLEIRELARARIQERAGMTIVAEHYSLPRTPDIFSTQEESLVFEDVFSKADAAIYKVILYLGRSAQNVFEQRMHDNSSEAQR